MKKLDSLYLAGPYTRPDPIINTHAAIKVATAIYEDGLFLPTVPHLSLLWHMVEPRPIQFWYDLDYAYMDLCVYFMRLPGESSGADMEAVYADRIGLVDVPFTDLPPRIQNIWYTARGE